MLGREHLSLEELGRIDPEFGQQLREASQAAFACAEGSSTAAAPRAVSPAAFSIGGFSQSWLEGADFSGVVQSPSPGPDRPSSS